MSFSPVIPMGGYAGWAFLQRTMETQAAAFEKAPALRRDEDYFRERIGGITSAEELVSDRRLLKVALGAFGLDADIDNRYFVRKVLESAAGDDKALANRLADKQYLALADAFGFAETAPNTSKKGFADKILEQYRTRQFEIAVGDRNGDMRLAMNAQRALPELAAGSGSEDTKWFKVLGSEPLRNLFQKAFGLPTSFGSIDIDQQLTVMKDKASAVFGDTSVSQFADAEKVDTLVRRFLALSQANGTLSSGAPGSSALQILQGGQGTAASLLSIIAG